VILVVASKSGFVPSLIHTCRATPRRQQPNHHAVTMIRFTSQFALPALSGQRVRNIADVRVRRVQSNRWRSDGPPMVALPSHFEMKIRSLPGDRQGGGLVPVRPLLDAAQYCPFAFRCWSRYGLRSEQEQIDAQRGRGRRSRPDCTGVVWLGSTSIGCRLASAYPVDDFRNA
jgi:hypothetical protein